MTITSSASSSASSSPSLTKARSSTHAKVYPYSTQVLAQHQRAIFANMRTLSTNNTHQRIMNKLKPARPPSIASPQPPPSPSRPKASIVALKCPWKWREPFLRKRRISYIKKNCKMGDEIDPVDPFSFDQIKLKKTPVVESEEWKNIRDEISRLREYHQREAVWGVSQPRDEYSYPYQAKSIDQMLLSPHFLAALTKALQAQVHENRDVSLLSDLPSETLFLADDE